MMRVLDLFSGIGGFSLGLERAGMKTVAFCEIDPFCRRVLAKHWPDVPCHEDITKLRGSDVGAVDVVCGGFPCQDISSAGQRAGINGARSGLWFEYARLIGELRPRYVIVENVAGLLPRGMGDVLGELATLGYDAEWHCIPAAAVGAPHRRDRVWIVGYPNSPSQPNGAINDETQIMRGSISDAMRERLERAELLRKENSQFNGIGNEGWWLIEPNVGRVAARVSSWLDDRAGVTLDGQASALARAAGITKDLARVGCMRALRQYGELGKASHQIRRSDVFSCRLSQVSQAIARRRKASEPYEAMCGLWDEISPIPFEETQDVFQSMLERVGQEECKKALGCRTARLRALGNTVVPQIPELIGRAIMQVAA